LELACKVGSVSDLERAVEEGADVNWDGGAPLFLAIMGGHRQLLDRLLELGADPAPIVGNARLKKLTCREEVLDALCESCPPPVEDEEGEGAPAGPDLPEEEEMEAKADG